jgi:hypothetical protein
MIRTSDFHFIRYNLQLIELSLRDRKCVFKSVPIIYFNYMSQIKINLYNLLLMFRHDSKLYSNITNMTQN